MKQVLTVFNELLKGNKTFAIACIEDRTEWIISPKDHFVPILSRAELTV